MCVFSSASPWRSQTHYPGTIGEAGRRREAWRQSCRRWRGPAVHLRDAHNIMRAADRPRYIIPGRCPGMKIREWARAASAAPRPAPDVIVDVRRAPRYVADLSRKYRASSNLNNYRDGSASSCRLARGRPYRNFREYCRAGLGSSQVVASFETHSLPAPSR